MLKIRGVLLLFTAVVVGNCLCFNLYGNSKPYGKLDGAPISSLETNIQPHRHSIFLGMDNLPFNAYYAGLGISASYQFNFTKNFAWEIARGSYFFSVEKDLTTELAEEFRVNPERIEKVEAIVKSNIKYYFVYGKWLFLEKYIRYFRLGVLAGPAMAFTSEEMKFLANAGLCFDLSINRHFWATFEFQDSISIEEDFETYPAFNFGMKLSF